jgi:hypothetical protein
MVKTDAVFITLALAAMAAPAHADINVTSGTIGEFAPFGTPVTYTYGQTFLPSIGATELTSFSLFLKERIGGDGPIDLRGHLGTWDGSKLGTLLFSSSIVTMNAAGDMQQFLFTLNEPVAVVQGQSYVAFLSLAGLPPQGFSNFGMPGVFDAIPGTWVFNSATDFTDLSRTDWVSDTMLDVYITVDFNGDSLAPIPEPESWILLIAGFGLTGAVLRRRRCLSA